MQNKLVVRLGNYLEIVLVFKDAKAYKLNINKHNATLEFPLFHKKKVCGSWDVFTWAVFPVKRLICRDTFSCEVCLLRSAWYCWRNAEFWLKILFGSILKYSELLLLATVNSCPYLFVPTPIDVPKTMYPDINTINIRKLFFHHLFGCIIHVVVCPSIYLF